MQKDLNGAQLGLRQAAMVVGHKAVLSAIQ